MGSKYAPKEKVTPDIPSQNSPIFPHNEGRDNATQTQIATGRKGNHSSSATNGVESSATNASKHTMVPGSGSPRDIICGRGLHIMNRHGNHNLHLIVERYRPAYLISTRQDKAPITRRIVQELKSTGAMW
jgi:hypothetical protein